LNSLVTRRLIFLLLGLAVLFGALFGTRYYQVQRMAAEASVPPPPTTVSAARARTETWQPYVYAVGSLVATQGIDVSNEIAGHVKAIHFESGQRVERGDLLLELDDSVDQAELAGFIAERRLAQLEFRRIAKLYRKGSISRSEYDQAQAKLQNTQAQVASQRALIAKKAIRAPFAGLLGIRRVDLGQYLAPGSRVVSLQSLDPMYVDYSLPERHLAVLHAGQKVTFRVLTYPKRSFIGEISAIDAGVNETTRNVQVRATLKNEDELLRPGMFAEVQTQLPGQESVLTLPATAITYNPYGDSVFVVENEDGQLLVEPRWVKTGETRDGRVAIEQGLKMDELVVTAGQLKLRKGQPVRIDNSVNLDHSIIGP
jgi:membrane fusion protein (multidrug efflux system)